MSTTSKQDENFIKTIISSSILEVAIDWISDNLAVESVFPEDKIVEFSSENREPDDVFTDEQLSEWALNNGFVRSE